jgi:hypothetical protein
MPGNPTECREHAKECLKLAAEALSPLARVHFEDLAKTWGRLANDLDRTKALLTYWATIDDKAKAG